jgi:hypothetical protein
MSRAGSSQVSGTAVQWVSTVPLAASMVYFTPVIQKGLSDQSMSRNRIPSGTDSLK